MPAGFWIYAIPSLALLLLLAYLPAPPFPGHPLLESLKEAAFPRK